LINGWKKDELKRTDIPEASAGLKDALKKFQESIAIIGRGKEELARYAAQKGIDLPGEEKKKALHGMEVYKEYLAMHETLVKAENKLLVIDAERVASGQEEYATPKEKAALDKLVKVLDDIKAEADKVKKEDLDPAKAEIGKKHGETEKIIPRISLLEPGSLVNAGVTDFFKAIASAVKKLFGLSEKAEEAVDELGDAVKESKKDAKPEKETKAEEKKETPAHEAKETPAEEKAEHKEEKETKPEEK